MIAKSRQMAAHDFLLVLLSTAVLTLLLWPPSPAVREVEIRRNDGSLQAYQLAASDPKLANLEEKLQRWSKPKTSSRLAISKWHAELGGLYADRTKPRVKEQRRRILPVSYYSEQEEKRNAAARETTQLKQQHAYWVEFQRQAERAVLGEQQRQEQLLALRSNPAVTIGELQPGPYTSQALLSSSIIGLCAAMLFGAWTYLTPSIQLVRQASATSVPPAAKTSHVSPSQAREQTTPEAINSLQFQVMLPAKWLRVHQPLGVWVRQAAYLTLILSVVLVASSSVITPQPTWRGFPARVIWGENNSSSLSPLRSRSAKPVTRMQKSATSMLRPLVQQL